MSREVECEICGITIGYYDGEQHIPSWSFQCEDCHEQATIKTYKLIRHRFKGDNEVIQRGLTLEEAQEWCSREDTHGDGWFDGYEEE